MTHDGDNTVLRRDPCHAHARAYDPRMGSCTELSRNTHWRLLSDGDRGVLILERTPEPFVDLSALGPANDPILKLLTTHAATGKARLLLDLRQGPGRNDAPFEQATEAARRGLFDLFGRVAVLVRTQVGKLQVSRLQKSDGADPHAVFTDEAEAIAWLVR
jgi:hypothetical protein